jgi:hypothetical protein
MQWPKPLTLLLLLVAISPLTADENREIPPAPPLPISHSSLIGLDKDNQNQVSTNITDPKTVALALEKQDLPTLWIPLGIALLSIIALSRWLIPWAHARIKRALLPTPHAKALKSLRKLDYLKLPENSQSTDYYSKTSLIIRKFLEEQFKLKVMASTTQEFLDQLIAQPIFKKGMQQRLQHFLQHVDLVKFAHHNPSLEECRQMRQTAQQLIDDCIK